MPIADSYQEDKFEEAHERKPSDLINKRRSECRWYKNVGFSSELNMSRLDNIFDQLEFHSEDLG